MKMTTIVALVALAFSLSCGTRPSADAGQQQRVNAEAATLQDFQRRIDAYLDLRKRVDDGAPKLKETNDPGKIREAQTALAKRIQAGRATARHGDIFTPEVQKLFRRLMYPELKGPDAAETKQAIKDDAPAPGEIHFKVNASYPEGQPLPTVPPDLLGRLPKLPEDLEFRIIGKHMILRDVDANVIVDYLPNAIR